MSQHPTTPHRPSLLRPALELLAISFVVLFEELTLIRWLPSQVRVLAYFPNLILISAFLGLGIGCLRAGRRSLLWLWPVSLVALVGLATALGRVVFTQASVSEHLWLLYYDLPADSPVINGVRLPIILAFVLSAVSFIPLGQLVAERLRTFARYGHALWGYSWDLLGSLVGVVAFSLLGVTKTFPVVWFSVFLVVALVFFIPRTRLIPLLLACAALTVFMVNRTERSSYYSPYYAISFAQENQVGFALLTNGSLHQHALSLEKTDAPANDNHALIQEGYHFPYRQLAEPPGRVLVLGAGTGNDVAVALDEGARQVDAVEIDPVILNLGRARHPNRPYSSDRVRVINADARSFLNNTETEYDLIVFGTLDSMTRLSAMSNVRLDNFVYTLDCIRAARKLVAPGGGMVLHFMASKDYISNRLVSMVARTFEEPPALSTKYHRLFNRTILAGPAFAHLTNHTPQQREEFFRNFVDVVEVPTDDWPYLYLRSRSISSFYLSLMAVFLVLTLTGVLIASPGVRESLGRGSKGIDMEMMLFGLAFLLIETKFVTAMNLLWGATWITSAVVFGSILATVLLATAATKLRQLPWGLSAAGLLVSLLVTYLVPIQVLLHTQTTARLALSILFVGTPVFFASVCFAVRFQQREDAGLAFGWNLLGAVLGGFLEFSSMVLGFKAMTLVAVGSYLAAFLIREKEKARVASRRAAGPLDGGLERIVQSDAQALLDLRQQ